LYKVIVTSKADSDEAAIYQYISEEFGEIYAEKFRGKLIEFFKLLSKHPFIGRPAKNDSTIKVYVFNRQNKIIYKVIEDSIVIIRILDTKTRYSSKF
jgi:plasmid stabilization system protein ParE